MEQSLQQNQPVIAASIQYRLGALGSLLTPEETETNIFLRDQRNGLLWIQKFISGFGGDAKRVTAFGESGGSISICYHMLSDVPLFNRVGLMSGLVSAMMAPRRKDEAKRQYERLLEVLGIEERGAEGLEKLRKVDVEKVVEAASDKMSGEGYLWAPVEDPEWFGNRAGFTWDQVPELLGQCEWVQDVLMGVTGFEVSALVPDLRRLKLRILTKEKGLTQIDNVKHLTPKSFSDGILELVGQENGKRMLDAYKITPEMDRNIFLISAMRWWGDVVFDGK